MGDGTLVGYDPNLLIREAGSTPVIYACWARKHEKEAQDQMNEVHRRVAQEIDALIAPVGEKWWNYQESRPEIEMFLYDCCKFFVR